MLEHFPIDIFRIIYQHLNVRDIHTLASVNKGLLNTMLTDNPFWRDQFQRHFPHRMNEIIKKGEPKSWYLIFKETFLAEYELNLGDEKKQKEAYKKSILFSAAKNGDATELKKFFQTPDFLKKNTRDKTNHSIYYWLYQNGDQHLLDSLFNEFSGSLSEVDKFSFAILCNQQNYIEQCSISNQYPRMESLRLAIEIGSVDLIALLFKKLNMTVDRNLDFGYVHRLFVQAASLGHTDVVEFLHQKIIASGQFKVKPGLYCDSIQDALGSTMRFEHKDTFEKILSIYDKQIWGDILNGRVDPHIDFLIIKAARMKDPDYADMLLKAGAHPNVEPPASSPLKIAMGNNHYDVSIILLKHGAKFDASDCSWAKACLNAPKEMDPRLCALAKLLIYKHEINHSFQTPLSFFYSNVLATERPQNKAVQCKVCDILLNVVTGKSSVEQLLSLNEIEKAALHEKDSTLGAIFEGFSQEIEKMKEAETKQSSDLHGLN